MPTRGDGATWHQGSLLLFSLLCTAHASKEGHPGGKGGNELPRLNLSDAACGIEASALLSDALTEDNLR